MGIEFEILIGQFILNPMYALHEPAFRRQNSSELMYISKYDNQAARLAASSRI